MMQFERYGVLVSSQEGVVNGDNSEKSMPLARLLEAPDARKYAELLWRISLPLMATLLMLLAIPLGFVNPRVGRSANLIVALLCTVMYLSMVNVSQAMVAQGRAGFDRAWWPVHLITATVIALLFLWRLKIHHRWHPLVCGHVAKPVCAVRKDARDENPATLFRVRNSARGWFRHAGIAGAVHLF
jgi:lipopolysaccharide export system permease protein